MNKNATEISEREKYTFKFTGEEGLLQEQNPLLKAEVSYRKGKERKRNFAEVEDDKVAKYLCLLNSDKSDERKQWFPQKVISFRK